MNQKTNRCYWVALCLLLLTHVSLAAPLKVAFLYEHPINAGGWSQSHEQSRLAVQEYFGDKIETSAIEGVTPGPDTVRILNNLARSGYGLIFATSFGHMNPVLKVARAFPNTSFEHASGYKQAANVGTYQIKAMEGRYLAGMLAGRMTKTNRIGYVGAFPIPEVVRGINAFTLGAKATNPNITVNVIWINSWLDAAKEREAAELLINADADIITHHTETPAILLAAEKAGVYAIGYQFDRSAYAANFHLVSIEHNWTPIYIEKIQAKLDNAWTSTSIWRGVDVDASRLVALSPNVSAETKQLLEHAKQDIATGTLKIFSGPIQDTTGIERVEAGRFLTDEELIQLEWFVKGVVTSL